MKKYQGYAQNEKFKVGLNGKTVYIFDNDENELARFQDAPYMYRGKFIPNTNTLVVKSTAGWLLFYDLDNLVLIKKIRFSNIGSQTKNFAITQDGKYLYNIEAPNYSIRTQLTKYDLRTLKPVITSFHNSETIFLEYVEISNEAIFLFGFMRNDKGIKDYGFISQYKEIGEKCILRDGKRIADVVYEKISQYKGCEDFGFTKKSLEYSGLEKIEDLEPCTLSGVYQDIIESNKARGRMGADPNHKSHPLLKALGRKNKDNPAILKLFIRYGVDLKAEVNGSTVEETVRSFGDEALSQILDKNKPPKGMNGMNMYFSARTQTLVQFKKVYDKRLLNETPKNDSPLIFCAMANQTPQNRYDIVKFLIGEGAELKGTNAENETLFHILFSRPKHIMEQTVELTQILIEAGADINQLDAKHRVAIQYLISHPKFTDEDFAPLYDVIFQNCTLEVNVKNDWGYTPIELARKLPYRADLLKRMTE